MVKKVEEKKEEEVKGPDYLSRFEAHRETVEKTSPLSLIREKEIELNTVVLETKKKAESIVAQARKKGAVLKERAIDSGVKKGQAKYKKGIEKAKQEAKSIRDSAAREVAKAQMLGDRNLYKAIQEILEAILP